MPRYPKITSYQAKKLSRASVSRLWNRGIYAGYHYDGDAPHQRYDNWPAMKRLVESGMLEVNRYKSWHDETRQDIYLKTTKRGEALLAYLRQRKARRLRIH